MIFLILISQTEKYRLIVHDSVMGQSTGSENLQRHSLMLNVALRCSGQIVRTVGLTFLTIFNDVQLALKYRSSVLLLAFWDYISREARYLVMLMFGITNIKCNPLHDWTKFRPQTVTICDIWNCLPCLLSSNLSPGFRLMTMNIDGFAGYWAFFKVW